MTFFGMALLTAIATVILAVFAVVTAWYARKAFREQSREVAAIEQQVKDEQEVTRQQAELLKVQTGQLEVLRAQFDDQRKASAKQAEVLELQAAELHESLDERKREAEQQRRAQASLVFIAEEPFPGRKGEPIHGAKERVLLDALNTDATSHSPPEPGLLVTGGKQQQPADLQRRTWLASWHRPLGRAGVTRRDPARGSPTVRPNVPSRHERGGQWRRPAVHRRRRGGVGRPP